MWHRLFCRLKTNDAGKIAEQGEGAKKEPQYCTRPTPRFATKFSTWNQLYELILKFLWWKIREIRSRNCISVDSQTLQTSSVGRRISRPKCALVQVVLLTRCCGSKMVEVAKSVDDLMTRSRVEGTYPDFWDAWCENCVCVEDDVQSVLQKEN